MKKENIGIALLVLIIAIIMSGCSTFIPTIKHDPAQVELYIKFKDEYEDLACNSKDENWKTWEEAMKKAHRLYLYTEYRQDPQTENVKQMETSLFSAYKGRETFCEAKIKLIGIQMDILEKAWRGRE